MEGRSISPVEFCELTGAFGHDEAPALIFTIAGRKAPVGQWYSKVGPFNGFLAGMLKMQTPPDMYVQLGRPAKDVTWRKAKKLTKADMAGSRIGWVDIDPPKDADAYTGRQVRDIIERLRSLDAPIRWAVASGRGLWAGVEFESEQDAETTEGVNLWLRMLAESLGLGVADACHNVDRIGRLPGTRNAKTGQLATARIYDDEVKLDSTSAAYYADQGLEWYAERGGKMAPAPAGDEAPPVEGLPKPDRRVMWSQRWADALESLQHPPLGNGRPYSGDRSKSALQHRATIYAQRAGYSPTDIYVAIAQTRLGRELNAKQDLWRSVERSFEKAYEAQQDADDGEERLSEQECYELLLRDYGDRLAYVVENEAVGTALVSGDDGCWIGVSRSAHSPGRTLIMDWLSPLVQAHMVKDNDRAGVVGRVLDGGSGLARVTWRELNRWDRHPCVPVPGGAIDLLGDGVLAPEQVRPLMLRMVWRAPAPPDMDALAAGHEAVDELLAVFGPAADLFAYALAVRSKSVAQVKLGRMNAGKSTFLEMLEAAFGDAVQVIPQTEHLPTGEGFTAEYVALGDRLVLIIDECDKIKPAGMTAADRLVSSNVRLHLKFQDPYTVKRLGSPFMIGNDWPAWKYEQKGMAGEPGDWGRVDELCVLLAADGGADRMTRKRRRALLADDACAYLRAWVIARARVYAADPDEDFDALCLPSTKAALDAGRSEVAKRVAEANDDADEGVSIADRIDDLMDDLLYTGDDDDLLVVADVKRRLGLTVKASLPPELQKAMEDESGVRPKRKQHPDDEGIRRHVLDGLALGEQRWAADVRLDHAAVRCPGARRRRLLPDASDGQ